MPPFAGRGYHHAIAQEKNMNSMQRWNMSPMRLPGEFPSWELCENRQKIKPEDLGLDPPPVCSPLRGMQHQPDLFVLGQISYEKLMIYKHLDFFPT